MSAPTFDAQRIRQRAKKADSQEVGLRRWWSQKYRRPMNDPLLQELDLAELLEEFLRDARAELEALKRRPIDENDPMGQSERMQQVARLTELVHGLDETSLEDLAKNDPQVAKWEKQVRRGKTPEGFTSFEEEKARYRAAKAKEKRRG